MKSILLSVQSDSSMKDKRIIITGGAGSIGSELVRQLATDNTIMVLDINETAMFDLVEELKLDNKKIYGHVVDVRDKDALDIVFDNFEPNVVFNCAARKHVTPMENTPMEAVNVNIAGTWNLINMCGMYGVRTLVNISTDKVVNADCVMGATKKVAEIMVKNAGYTSVRFGNVMGSNGSVIKIWQKQIEDGKPLTVTDDKMTRYMMTIDQACFLVIQAAMTEDRKGKVFILDMGEPHNILQLAKDILKKADKAENIRMIGMRPGEKLYEKIMSDDEQKTAIKTGNFWIL